MVVVCWIFYLFLVVVCCDGNVIDYVEWLGDLGFVGGEKFVIVVVVGYKM